MICYTLPRFCGNPFQVYLETEAAFKTFVRENSGTYPTFTGHNAFLDPRGDRIEHRYVVFDIDTPNGGKLDNALADAIALRKWAKDKGIETITTFTGSRGFHVYLVFAPCIVEGGAELRQVYYAIHSTAAAEAKLRYVDTHLFGDVRRMIRVVGSKHQDTGLYCLELPDELIERGDVAAILEYAKEPRPAPQGPYPKETLPEAVRRIGFKVAPQDTQSTAPTIPYRDTSVPEFVRLMLPRHCIHNGIVQTNPPHFIRVEACSSLVRLGFDLPFLQTFFDKLSEYAKWVDRKNVSIRHYHVAQIWQKRGYEQYSCKRIRDGGYCVGPSCPLFAVMWPNEVPAKAEVKEEPK